MDIRLIGPMPSSTTTLMYNFMVNGELFPLGITHQALVVLVPPVGSATSQQIEAIGKAKIELETVSLEKLPQPGVVVRTEDVKEIRKYL